MQKSFILIEDQENGDKYVDADNGHVFRVYRMKQGHGTIIVIVFVFGNTEDDQIVLREYEEDNEENFLLAQLTLNAIMDQMGPIIGVDMLEHRVISGVHEPNYGDLYQDENGNGEDIDDSEPEDETKNEEEGSDTGTDENEE